MGTINTSLYLQNIGVQGFLTQEQLAGLSIAIQTDTTSGGYTGKFYDKYGNVVTVIKGLVMSVLPQSIKLTVNEQFDYFTFTGSDIFVDWGTYRDVTEKQHQEKIFLLLPREQESRWH